MGLAEMALQKFTVTKDHLALAKHMNVEWWPTDYGIGGSPVIDFRRPYGNSDVFKDMGEILKIKPKPPKGGWKAGEEVDFSEQQIEWMKKLHQEMKTVIHIGLVTGRFKTGTYVATDAYSDDWKLLKKR